MTGSISVFLSGMTSALFLTAAIFFLKFWKASRNRFFGFFASACALLAVERLISLCVYEMMSPERYDSTDARASVYLLRLAAFVVIFIAIVDRNRTKLAQQKSLSRGH